MDAPPWLPALGAAELWLLPVVVVVRKDEVVLPEPLENTTPSNKTMYGLLHCFKKVAYHKNNPNSSDTCKFHCRQMVVTEVQSATQATLQPDKTLLFNLPSANIRNVRKRFLS